MYLDLEHYHTQEIFYILLVALTGAGLFDKPNLLLKSPGSICGKILSGSAAGLIGVPCISVAA